MSAALLLEQLINGLTLGIYALVALRYTLVYGVLRMINFAHSELFMGGAVAGWAVLTVFPIHGAWAVVFTLSRPWWSSADSRFSSTGRPTRPAPRAASCPSFRPSALLRLCCRTPSSSGATTSCLSPRRCPFGRTPWAP